MNSPITLPGLIDIHVHFRDPGQTEKEDFHTGTRAALAGGVTTVFDMPNNKEPILTLSRLNAKRKIIEKKAVCDFGLYFGTDGKNIHEFPKVKDLVVGLKVFLNLTTGKLLIEDERLVEKVFASWPKEKVIVVHAEGEKIDLAIQLCSRYGNKIHITHIATRNDLEKVIIAKRKKLPVTCDVTPHHLFLFNDQKENIFYSTLGREKIEYNVSKMIVVKPSIARRRDVEYIWEQLTYVDCIATDHAPHTREEKQSSNPASGVPGLETMLPLLLTAVKQKRLTLADIIRLTNTNPQKIFGIKQDKDAYVEINTEEEYEVKNENLFTKCGWSPFDGWNVYGKVKTVYIRGEKVFTDGKVLASAGFGKCMHN